MCGTAAARRVPFGALTANGEQKCGHTLCSASARPDVSPPYQPKWHRACRKHQREVVVGWQNYALGNAGCFSTKRQLLNLTHRPRVHKTKISPPLWQKQKLPFPCFGLTTSFVPAAACGSSAIEPGANKLGWAQIQQRYERKNARLAISNATSWAGAKK